MTSGGGNPLYQWEVNGGGAGSNSNTFTISTLNNGDVISCAYSDNTGCAVAPSNTIIAQVEPIPVVSTAPPIILSGGQSATLDLPVTGDVTSYVWAPATGLSDPDVAEPIATPMTTTTYTLRIRSPAGCIDSGQVVVMVGSKLAIPSAFSPNGDGHNDIFYVIGGPAGSVVKELAVFDRWGQRIFQAHDTAPDDSAYGWNGTIGGQPAAPGAYVYVIQMDFAGGTQQVYKGTVVLVR